ncbi:hypothetical protein M8C21_004740 [Ambrosia artemisiifolia]|uniref:Lipoxygenase n=1 Tax=Ambrosia artemisiifolia TaxID=4212 RepID=A0AAD5GCP2_AMBAR|nr:hypothetical protein M8C21_004740 [Ambrosia artemisiifolia]
MLKPQINQSHSLHNLLPLHKPFVTGDTTNHSSSVYSLTNLRQDASTKKTNATRARSTSGTNSIKAISIPFITKATTVKGVITIQPTLQSALAGVGVGGVVDAKGNRKTVKAYARYDALDFHINVYTYKCNFDVPEDFGQIGAILVENEYSKKMFFKTIVLDNGVTFTCESWVQSKYDSYLPSETPEALKSLRTEDLESLRGNGEGERKSYDRIYDYDVYNDLGYPDLSLSLARPVLGGEQHPYPRRCRTGRPMSSKDPLTETRTLLPFYVPCDEDFSEIKSAQFGARTLYSALHAVVPTLDSVFTDIDKGFPLFTDIDLLYNQGVNVPPQNNGIASVLPRLVKGAVDTANTVIKFETPETIDRDSFSWFRDEEFCRQMLAGLNPYSIQLVTEWPLMSKLDPEIYGPPESAITKEIVQQEIGGFMTFDEALAQKKLFMLDFHDLLLPYVNKTRELGGRSLYGSRTLMFLTPAGTLRPLAIELTRPPSDGKPQWKHVYTPTWDATGAWLWKLAKAQVLSHDSAYHQLVSHWLRTHCVTEPYIIATNRHLSQMHPIQRLLLPHFRYTMQINSLARLALINAGGIIELTFSPGKYCMQICSDAYDQLWRFDHDALPADLISRGMAVEDPTAPHGVKLTIEDYPFANDAVNFGQYDFAGYFPNRPTIARTKMPNEDPTDEEWQSFIKRPEDLLLKCFPSQIQATQVMTVLDVLSSHSPEEEYIGGTIEPAWEAEPAIKAAFEEFQGRLNQVESVVDTRNSDPLLKNRSGAGLVPYQLLKPYSDSGVTMKGVPNSISI